MFYKGILAIIRVVARSPMLVLRFKFTCVNPACMWHPQAVPEVDTAACEKRLVLHCYKSHFVCSRMYTFIYKGILDVAIVPRSKTLINQ